MTGWRVGWMIAPEAVAQSRHQAAGAPHLDVNDIAQQAALTAVSGPLDAVAQMREAFDTRRHTIVDALNVIPGVKCALPHGAFYAFCDVRGLLNTPHGPHNTVATTSAQLADVLLEEAHIAAVPGEAFGAEGYLGSPYAHGHDLITEGMPSLPCMGGQ